MSSQTVSALLIVALLVGLGCFLTGVFLLKKKEGKERLAALPKEIHAALAKALASTRACAEMKLAAILAERAFSAAGIDAKKWKYSDGPTDKEILIKTKAASIAALGELKRLSIEAVRLKTCAAYSELRTAAIISFAACEACTQSLDQQACPAAMILEKIELT